MSETSLSELAVYSARPTLRVNGEEQHAVQQLVLDLEVRESEGGMSALELRVNNVASQASGDAHLAWDDGEVLRLGASITVSTGDERSPVEIFGGTITGLEGHFPEADAPTLVVLAEDALQRARMVRRTAVYEDTSLSRLATRIAGHLGLTARVSGLGENIGTQVQLNESDLAFLRRLLAAHDGDLHVTGTELHVAPRGEIRRNSVDLQLHSQLRSARLLADLSHQVTEVTATGWDPVQGSRIVARSTGSHPGPGAGRSGTDFLEDTFDSRSEHVRDIAVMTDAEGRALADAAFDRRARRFVTVEGTAEGNPAIRVGTHLHLSGLSSRWDNTYYVVGATHRFDRVDGYRTDFEAECAFFRG